MSWACLALEQRINYQASYFVDAAGDQTIESIQRQDFSEYKSDLRLGYSDHPIWIRIKVAPVFENFSFQANPLKLRIGPYFIDRLEKYEEINHNWEKVVKGATIKEDNDSCFDDAHCFKLLSNPSIPNVIYVKLQTKGVIFLNIDLMDSERLALLNISKVRSTTLSIAFAGMFLLFALVILIFRPSYLIFSYVCLQLVIVFNLLYSTGLVTSFVEFMTPLQIKEISHYFTCLRALLIAQLIFSFLKPYQLNKTYGFLLKMVFVFTVIDFALIAFGLINWALKLQLCIHLFNIVIQIYGFYTCDFKNKGMKNLLLLSTVVYLFLFSYGVSNVMGWLDIKAPFVLQYYSNLNGTFVGLLLLLVGLYQSRLQQLAKEEEIENLKLLSFEAKLNSEKYKERSSLIDLLTHELMNPLGAIKFALASIKRESSGGESSGLRLQRIESSIERMKNLIEQVALSNRLESHDQNYPLEKIDAQNIIEELIGDYADESRFSVEIEPGAHFFTNPVLLSHILKNLIDNAYKYDSREEKIKLFISKSPMAIGEVLRLLDKNSLTRDDLTYVEISNAFALDQRPDELKVFDRYYRQENVMTKPGMGIGLSIVKTSLDKLDGEIHFSIQGQRAIFKLVL